MWKLQDLESAVIWSEKRYLTQNDEKSKINDDSVESHNYLRKDGARLSVCHEMFLSTLGLGELSVRDWVMSSVRQR